MLSGLFTPTHVALIVGVLLLILGPKRLPETGRALGHGIREFREAIIGAPGNSSEADLEPPPKPET